MNEFVCNWQKGKRKKGVKAPKRPEDEICLALGSLWGEQLTRTLDWEWTGVSFHEHGDSAVGVVSPKRSMAIYPFHFVFGCMKHQATVTIELAYNMLVDGRRIPKLPARGFANVMEHLQHIVPPD